jgi:tRNA threonylcarbamoyladenosine biosynthesis protein TsaB
VLSIAVAVQAPTSAVGQMPEREPATFSLEVNDGTRHSELLPSSVDALLELAGIGKRDIGLCACMRGPGSFTGLRIAYATLKGIRAALGIPAVSVPTLDCMAWTQRRFDGTVIPLLDARRGHYFAAIYRGGIRSGGFLDEPLPAILDRVATGGDSRILFTGPAAEAAYDEAGCQSHIFVNGNSNRGYALDLLYYLLKNDNMKDTGEIEDEPFTGPLYMV